MASPKSSKNAKKAKAPLKKAAEPKKGGAMGSIKKILGLAAPKAKATPKAAAPKAKLAAKPAATKTVAKVVAKAVTKTATKTTAKPTAKTTKVATATVAPTSAKKNAKTEAPVTKKEVLVTKKSAAKSSAPNFERRSSSAPVCREVACELMATTNTYCRMHYIKNWQKIKRKELILKEKKLNHYIEELVSKYPDKYIEAIRQDLASEKDFAKVIADLEVEEGLDDFEVETEGAEGIIDTLKRDFEDDGDVF